MSAPTKPRDAVISAALWVAGVAWLVPSLSALTLLQSVVHPKKVDRLSRVYTRGQILLTGSRWRAVVDPRVDPEKPYIFVQNHTNHLDHAVMYAATPHFKQGLELESHFDYPFYGWFMRKRGTIPVRPGSQGQSPEIMARMRAEVEAGHSIVAFPEGTRTRDGRVGPFRKGVFYIARDLGVPVVPVAVTGMYEVMRKGSWMIRPGHTVTVHVEAPIETAGLDDAGVAALTERAHGVIASKVDAHLHEHGRRAT